MSTAQDRVRRPAPSHQHHGVGVPLIGFVLSILLTLIALWAVMNKVMTSSGLVSLIMVLAVVQIGIQLFFFMHVTESKGRPFHVWLLGLGFAMTFAVVAGSIWVMTFGSEAY
ncbi:cytochrome C oxidase subunit IV family protein [Alicyclobacillus curvatus]|nr:cytochrome C oxidase subunit IV family protein [Alicyclobacillus curvatus]